MLYALLGAILELLLLVDVDVDDLPTNFLEKAVGEKERDIGANDNVATIVIKWKVDFIGISTVILVSAFHLQLYLVPYIFLMISSSSRAASLLYRPLSAVRV